jgi:hypothetical protein
VKEAAMNGINRFDTAKRDTDYLMKPLNELEVTSVRALVAYVAHTQSASDVTVCEVLGAKFGAPDVGALRRRDYDEVIRFLVDLKLNETLN